MRHNRPQETVLKSVYYPLVRRSSQVKQPANQLHSPIKTVRLNTLVRLHADQQPKKHSPEWQQQHGSASAFFDFVAPVKSCWYGRQKVIILTLSCQLTKMALRGHTAQVKLYSNSTGSSKKGKNLSPVLGVNILNYPPARLEVTNLRNDLT